MWLWITTSIEWTYDSHGQIPEAVALAEHYVIILRILSGLVTISNVIEVSVWTFEKKNDFISNTYANNPPVGALAH